MKKVTTINLRITAKRLAHLPTLTKTPEKFQTDPAKTVGGVAFTIFCDGQSDGRTDRRMHGGETIRLPTLTGGDIIHVSDNIRFLFHYLYSMKNAHF